MPRQECLDKAGKGISIFVHTEKCLVLVFARHARKAGAGSIDKHQIAGIEQAAFVVDQRIGRRRRVAVIAGHHAARAKCAHVQPHRRRAGAAVEQERDRPIGCRRALFEIGDIEHRCFGAGLGFVIGFASRRPPGRIIPMCGMDDDRSRDGLIIDFLPFDRDRTRCRNLGFLENCVGAGRRRIGLVGGNCRRGGQRQNARGKQMERQAVQH